MGIIILLVSLIIIVIAVIIYLIFFYKINQEKFTQKLEQIDMKKQLKLIDYNIYVMTVKEKIKYIMLSAVVLFTIGYIFYKNIMLALIFSSFSILYPKIKNKEIVKKRKEQLKVQFKDGLYALASALSAGQSIEKAFQTALNDLDSEMNLYIIEEFGYIVRKVQINETIESALMDFARRSHLEDVKSFADVFITCKRTEGDIISIIKSTSNIIAEKIEIKKEIEIFIAQKKFEQKILMIMPIIILIFLSVVAQDYMEPMYTEVYGRIIMTVALILIGISYKISNKIMDIEV